MLPGAKHVEISSDWVLKNSSGCGTEVEPADDNLDIVSSNPAIFPCRSKNWQCLEFTFYALDLSITNVQMDLLWLNE